MVTKDALPEIEWNIQLPTNAIAEPKFYAYFYISPLELVKEVIGVLET